MAGPAVPIRGNALIPRAADNDVRRLATPIVMAGRGAAGAASRASGIFGAWYYAGQQAAPVPARNATNLPTPRTTEGHGARVAAPADRELRALGACPRSSVLESRCVALGQEIARFPPVADQAGAVHVVALPMTYACRNAIGLRRIAPPRWAMSSLCAASPRRAARDIASLSLMQRASTCGSGPNRRALGPLPATLVRFAAQAIKGRGRTLLLGCLWGPCTNSLACRRRAIRAGRRATSSTGWQNLMHLFQPRTRRRRR